MRSLAILLITLFFFSICDRLHAQGCVAIRCASFGGANLTLTNNVGKGEFLSQAGYRYFKSYRHFRGNHEETHRVEEGTEVINNSHFVDLGLTYGITDRLYVNTIVPFVFHTRSSMYEHGGNPPNGLGERHTTSSSGLADIRLGLGYWLFDPHKQTKFNYAVQLGVKLPTGSYDYKDTFYNQGENRDEDIETVVDQSIQPGDGGTGITLDVQGFQMLGNAFMLSANLYYLSNFQESNGVLTRNGSSEFSCPDQYAARVGVFYNPNFYGLSGFLGGRIEGIPSEDIFGSSAGYRRPGYAISVEPGISYAYDMFAVNLTVPIAVERNRTQSYEDKQRTAETGVYRHGDAAFADFLINFSVAYRFGAKHKMAEPSDTPTWKEVGEN